MQFKIITKNVLRECISNILMNNYKKSYLDFRKFVKLDISKDKFEEFKKRKVTDEEISDLLSKNKIDSEKEVKRIKKIWNGEEDDIVKTMNEITKADINTNEITCYIDPYQNGGYYGEDNITVGTYKNPEDVLFVIAHELFHVFYWRMLAKLNVTKSIMGKEELFEWGIAEGTVHLLITEPRMRIFWKNIEIEIYPEIEGILKKVEPIWRENSFEDYLRKSYELFKK